MSRVSEGILKLKLFGMLDEYFEMSDQICGDVKESLGVFKAQQLQLSHGKQKQMVQIYQKSSKFLEISPESVQKPLSTSFSEKTHSFKGSLNKSSQIWSKT